MLKSEIKLMWPFGSMGYSTSRGGTPSFVLYQVCPNINFCQNNRVSKFVKYFKNWVHDSLQRQTNVLRIISKIQPLYFLPFVTFQQYAKKMALSLT